MKARKILAFLMVGLLGANASFASAELEPRINAIDNYVHYEDFEGCVDVWGEGRYYGANVFLGGSSCMESGHYTQTDATTLTASWSPEEGKYCPAETKSVVGLNRSQIDQNSFSLVVAGSYQTTGVQFTHYHQKASSAMNHFHTGLVKE